MSDEYLWTGRSIPAPGPDFVAAACAVTGTDPGAILPARRWQEWDEDLLDALDQLYRAVLYVPGTQLQIETESGVRVVSTLCGHIWSEHAREFAAYQKAQRLDCPPVSGPQPAEVMVIGKMPWREEIHWGRNLIGGGGALLHRTLNRLGIPHQNWYVTNLVKWMPPDGGTTLRSAWKRDCLPLLWLEIHLVRPRYILCLGADAVKALVPGGRSIRDMIGRVERLTWSSRDEAEQEARVMAVVHPAEAARDRGRIAELASGLRRFHGLMSGRSGTVCQSVHTVTDLAGLRTVLRRAEEALRSAPVQERWVAMDAEWHGRYPCEPDSYVRTIQWSWSDDEAAVLVVSRPGGEWLWNKDSWAKAVALLRRFLRTKRVVGHFFLNDLLWLRYLGFDPVEHGRIPLAPPEQKPWERYAVSQGWLDTMAAAHALNETGPFDLNSLAMRYTSLARWDTAMEQWQQDYCREHNLRRSELNGFGSCPDEILIPYAAGDVVATRQLAQKLVRLLYHDSLGLNCWQPCWETMIVQDILYRMRIYGLGLDTQRLRMYGQLFQTARDALESRIREWCQWPDLKLRSVDHVRELLYGVHYVNGDRRSPATARLLDLRPILDTSKPGRRWEQIERSGETGAKPSTSKLVLGVLYHENAACREQLGWLRDYRFLDQACKTVLPAAVAEGEDDEGEDRGLLSYVNADGRIRTRLVPSTETGRWRSAEPNLQNLSKTRDLDYGRILGSSYQGGIRSCLCATGWYQPRAWRTRARHLRWMAEMPGEVEHRTRYRDRRKRVLVECDYRGAELFGAAVMSGDKAMIEHVQRAALPDSGYDKNGRPCPNGKYPHPDYYDLHAHTAVAAFRLNCPPTKQGLKEAGVGHLRDIAKIVNFRIAYGSGARGIALQAREQGVEVSDEDAQRVMDTVFERYPRLYDFFQACRRRVVDPGWITHAFGRYRRFPPVRDEAMLAELERQAMNQPIQGLVASIMDRGLAVLQHAIDRHGLQDEIRPVLQVHDACIVEVLPELVEYVVEQLLPFALVRSVPVYPTDLDGRPRGDGPYFMALETHVYGRWGMPLTAAECRQLGLPPRYGGG